MKIYSDDPLVHYQNTSVSPERTKAEIDALLGYWGVSDVHWHWKPQENDVFVQFILEEKIDDQPLKTAVKVACPIIWDKERPRARPPQIESVNWRVSMRSLWWYLKTHLEMSYAMQSSKTVAFLPYITSDKGTALKDLIIPRLSKIQQLEYEPTDAEEQRQKDKIIDVPAEKTET